MATVLPPRSAELSGAEFSHVVAPWNEGRLPSDGSAGWNSTFDCVLAQARPMPAAARATAPAPRNCRRFPLTPPTRTDSACLIDALRASIAGPDVAYTSRRLLPALKG